MLGLRALAWLACVAGLAASANGPPKRNAFAKAAAEQASGATTAREVAARNAAAEMIKSKRATQTRPAFEEGRRRLECVDVDSGATDKFGDDCSWYASGSNDKSCGDYDDEDFTASEQCCACGGGIMNVLATICDVKRLDRELKCNPGEEFDSYLGNCMPCGPGRFSQNGEGGCLPCPSNSYSTEPRATDCINCEAGRTSSPGTNECFDCPIGTYRDNSMGTCLSCGYNRIPEVTRDRCVLCPAGTWGELEVAAGSCGLCPGGKYRTMDMLVCEECEPGTFSEAGSTECTACPPGTFSAGGAKECESCEPGRFSSNFGSTESEACAPGTVAPNARSPACTPCGINEYSVNATSCESCLPGESAQLGSSFCEECEAGRYRGKGQSDCTACPLNTASNNGSTACSVCPLGRFAPASSSECVSCAAGTKRGFKTDGETDDFCLDCSDNKFALPGSSECDLCLKDFYRDGDECKPCKSGMICDEPGVTIENVRLEKNHWRTSAESAKIETCPLKKSCRSTVDEVGVARRLEAAAAPATTTDAGEALCTKGHEGPLCAVCKRHYYRLGQECIKCRRSTIAFTVIGILVGIVIFLAFFLMAMSYSNVVAKGVNKSFETNQEEAEISLSRQGSTYFARADSAVQTADRPDPTDAGSGFKEWLEGEAAEALRRNVTTFVKQLSGTYSIFVNLPWVFDIKFPNIYERVLERLGLVNVDMSFSLECVISRKVTFQDRLLAATIGPMVAILLVTSVIGLGVLYLGFKRNEHKHRKDRKRTTIMVIAQLVLLILFLSYTSTSTTIFRAFRPCDKLDENYHGSKRYMHDDYSVSCKSSRYVFIVTWAALMLLVYPIGIPLVSFCLMWRHQEKLNPKVDSKFIDKDIKYETVGESDSAFRQACVKEKTELRSKAVAAKAQDRELVSAAQLFHFMYDNYEPQYWWFECFDYIRRLALTGLMVVILPGSALQGFIGVLIALGGLLAYNTFKPFAEDASDYLAMAAQLSTFFVFLSALMIQVDAVYHRKGFGVLLTVVTFIPPFVSLCCALHAFHSTKRSLPKLGSNKESTSKAPDPAKDDVANPESSPTSPLARGAPPQEDEEAPPAPAKN